MAKINYKFRQCGVARNKLLWNDCAEKLSPLSAYMTTTFSENNVNNMSMDLNIMR